MRLATCSVALFLALNAGTPVLAAGPVLSPAPVTIGSNLQTYTSIALSEAAPAGGLELTVTSDDPKRLLLSKSPEQPGTASIVLNVREKFRASPEFWLQALAESGDVTYSVSAPGCAPAKGMATLTPSGIAVVGPFGDAAPPEFMTTPRGWPTKIKVHAVRLDKSLNMVEAQYVRGGLELDIPFLNSDPAVGKIPTSVKIGAAEATTAIEFTPSAAGKTTISPKQPAGFRAPATHNSLLANVRAPGLAVADDMVVGENLQLAAALNLGEPAPKGGLEVTLTSSDPGKLLLSKQPNEAGKPAITVFMPDGGVSAIYYLQALGRSGKVSHTASAPGYRERTGTVSLAPSGVIICLTKHGPPDEAEVFRPESAGSRRNQLITTLSERKPTPVVVYTAFLDPVTRRTADITVQPLRAGMSLPVELKNSNPAVGTISSRITIQGGDEKAHTEFQPLSAGETVISVVAPRGFVEPSNATELVALVRE